jgi:hypothetical protein
MTNPNEAAHWSQRLDAALQAHFGPEFETEWNLFQAAYVTGRADEEPMTQEMHEFIGAWMTENVADAA